MDNYEKYMKKCINLAKKGRGKTSPNPMVGCVILNKRGEIISNGYHHKYGENHAERDALLKLHNGEENGGTLFVNLEPCSHQGKTPPCTDLIIERKLKRVVIGCTDKNPKVNGNGIKKLKTAGIEVISGILENECRKLNEIFFTDVEQNRIFIALKTATTIDGKISTSTGESKWITSEAARIYAKQLRTYYDAILTSSSTVISDNPTMEHKLKIILDREFKTNFSLNIYKTGEIILVTYPNIHIEKSDIPDNVTVLKSSVQNDLFDLKTLMNTLYKMGIKSIFVESGSKLSGAFIKYCNVDKIYQFIAPKIINDNNAKSCFDGDTVTKISKTKQFEIEEVQQIDSDVLITYMPQQK